MFIVAVIGSCVLGAHAQETAKTVRPVSYGIVVDNSGSYRMLLERVINLAHAVANRNGENDETFVVTFVDPIKIRVRQELTTDKQEIVESVDNMFVEGGRSAVLDAVRLSIDYLSSNSKATVERNLAMLLISDGDDQGSSAKIETILTAAKEANIKIIVVGISDEKVNVKLLDRLAKGTGGTAFYPRTQKETMALVPDIAAAIRSN
jgi:Ca-activated chloride channel family protein